MIHSLMTKSLSIRFYSHAVQIFSIDWALL